MRDAKGIEIDNIYFYRQIHFTNADACDPDGKVKTIHVGKHQMCDCEWNLVTKAIF